MRVKFEFDQRKGKEGSRKPKRKLIFVFEGTKTERIYFQAIQQKMMQKGLDVLVDVATLYRVGMETGLSNPLSIVKSVKRQLVNQQKGTLFAGDVLNGILDELVPPFDKRNEHAVRESEKKTL